MNRNKNQVNEFSEILLQRKKVNKDSSFGENLNTQSKMTHKGPYTSKELLKSFQERCWVAGFLLKEGSHSIQREGEKKIQSDRQTESVRQSPGFSLNSGIQDLVYLTCNQRRIFQLTSSSQLWPDTLPYSQQLGLSVEPVKALGVVATQDSSLQIIIQNYVTVPSPVNDSPGQRSCQTPVIRYDIAAARLQSDRERL